MHARLALLGADMKTPMDSKVMYRGEDYETRDHVTGRVCHERKVVLFVGSVFGDGTGIVYACTQLFWPDGTWLIKEHTISKSPEAIAHVRELHEQRLKNNEAKRAAL